MDAMNPDARALWSIACEDAGVSENAVVLELRDATGDPEKVSTMHFWPALAPVRAEDLEPPLEPDVVARLRKEARRPRIAVAGRNEAPELLGLMRNGLALAVQCQTDEAAWRFGWGVLDAALSRAYASLGRGGGVIHNAHPSMRDANGAAARLVTATQGPQLGGMHGPFGILFRTDRDFGGQPTMRKRLVAFAAMHAEDVIATVGQGSAEVVLAQLDEQASGWWRDLLNDEGFTHLRGSIPYFVPTASEIAASAPAEARAWQPLADLIDRALARGLEVLNSGRHAST
jgi:hypothetical protein